MTIPHCLVVRMLVGVVLSTACSSLSSGQAMPGSMRDVVIPIFDSKDQAAAVIHIARVQPGFQRRAFFRIGLLRQVVLEGLRVTFKRSDSALEPLLQIRNVPRISPTDPLTIQHFSIEVPGQSGLRLQAACVEARDSAPWSLTNVVFHEGAIEVNASTATLHVNGSESGRISLQTASGQLERTIFADVPTNQETSQ